MQCIFSCSQASFSVEDGVIQAKASRHQHTGNHDEKNQGSSLTVQNIHTPKYNGNSHNSAVQ